MEKHNIFHLYLWSKLISVKGLTYFFSASLALAREETSTSVSLRIGRVGYFSKNKFNVGLLTQNRKEKKNFSLNL